MDGWDNASDGWIRWMDQMDGSGDGSDNGSDRWIR